MRAFLHGRTQHLLGLMAVCNNLFRKYTERDLGLGASLADFLASAARIYADIGRQEVEGRSIRYTVRSYATDNPEGERYS